MKRKFKKRRIAISAMVFLSGGAIIGAGIGAFIGSQTWVIKGDPTKTAREMTSEDVYELAGWPQPDLENNISWVIHNKLNVVKNELHLKVKKCNSRVCEKTKELIIKGFKKIDYFTLFMEMVENEVLPKISLFFISHNSSKTITSKIAGQIVEFWNTGRLKKYIDLNDTDLKFDIDDVNFDDENDILSIRFVAKSENNVDKYRWMTKHY